MKRLLSLFSLVLVTVLLTACGGNTQDSTKAVVTTTKDPYTNLVSSVTGIEYDPCTLTYAAWDLGQEDSETPNMDRLMLRAFEAAYPGIKVKIVERPKIPGTNDDQGWDEFLTAKASVGMLPDVFQPDDIPLGIKNGWCYDLTALAKADEEYNKMSTDITDAATYDGHVMAIPQSIFYWGFLVNKTLYESKNLDAPTTDTTYDELMSLTKSAANHTSTVGNGVVGLSGIEHIIHWYASQLNTNYGWWTYDGEKFNLDSDEFSEAVSEYRKLRTDSSFVLEALQDLAMAEDSTIVLEDIFGTTDYTNDEKILCRFIASYEFGSYQSKLDRGELLDDYAFIGTPVIDGNKRVPVILDFLCVASTTEHPREAFLLAKWMGYGDDGYTERLILGDQFKDQNIELVNYPSMTGNKEHLDAYFDTFWAFEDLRDIIDNGTFIVEPPKFLPGYNAARYSGAYDVETNMYTEIVKIMDGQVNLADVKAELNRRANELMAADATLVKEAIAKLK